MPNVLQLITRLNYLVDDEVDEATAIELFNEAQEDLSEVAGYAKVAEADFYAGDAIIALPIDLIELVELRIKLNSASDFTRLAPYKLINQLDPFQAGQVADEGGPMGFEWFGDHIELVPVPQEDGKLQIRYYANLPRLTSVNDIPALRERFHRLLPLYAAAKYMQNWQDELAAKNDFYSEYLQGKEELRRDTMARKSRTRSRTVYQFRAWY